MIHVQDLTQVIRCYSDVSPEIDPFEARLDYDAALTVLFVTDTEAVITALCGDFSKSVYLEIAVYLRDRGIQTIKMERRGRYVTRDLSRLDQVLLRSS